MPSASEIERQDQEAAGVGHNSASVELRLLIERIERLQEEKKAIADDVKDVFVEAKARGYDPKIMRKVIAIRKMDKERRAEEEATLDTYLSALGLL